MSELPSVDITVKPEWIDHNGHMNVAYYVLAFDEATDDFYERRGLGLDYPESGYSVFTLGFTLHAMATPRWRPADELLHRALTSPTSPGNHIATNSSSSPPQRD